MRNAECPSRLPTRRKTPLNVASGGTIIPFSGIEISNASGFTQYGMPFSTGGGDLKIHLRSSSALTNLGTIVDPGPGRTPSFDPSTYTYTFRTLSSKYAPMYMENEILARLVYNAPTLPAGTVADVLADISFTGILCRSSGGLRPSIATRRPVYFFEDSAFNRAWHHVRTEIAHVRC